MYFQGSYYSLQKQAKISVFNGKTAKPLVYRQKIVFPPYWYFKKFPSNETIPLILSGECNLVHYCR
jgi:hypothetical protein